MSAAVLDAEERHAWNEYLAATCECPADGYEEVEPWAWAKLTLKLQAIHLRREALKTAA